MEKNNTSHTEKSAFSKTKKAAVKAEVKAEKKFFLCFVNKKIFFFSFFFFFFFFFANHHSFSNPPLVQP